MGYERKSELTSKPAIRLIAGHGISHAHTDVAAKALAKIIDNQTATSRALNYINGAMPQVAREMGRKFILIDGTALLAGVRAHNPDQVILSSYRRQGVTSLPTKDFRNLVAAAYTSIDAGGRGGSMAQVQHGRDNVLITQPRDTGSVLGLFFSYDKNGIYRGDNDYDLGKVINTKKLSSDPFTAIVDDHEYGHVQQWAFLRIYFPAMEKNSWFYNGNIQEADADSFAALKFIRDEADPGTIGAVREYAKARFLDVTLGESYGHDTSRVVAATANLTQNIHDKNWSDVDSELAAAFNYAGPNQQQRRKLGNEIKEILHSKGLAGLDDDALHHLSAALTHRHALDEAQLKANYEYFDTGSKALARRHSLNPLDMFVEQVARWSLNTPEKQALIKQETAETDRLLEPGAIKPTAVPRPSLPRLH